MSPGDTAPADRRATDSDDRVSSGDRWLDSEGESSARSYSDVARTPAARVAASRPRAHNDGLPSTSADSPGAPLRGPPHLWRRRRGR